MSSYDIVVLDVSSGVGDREDVVVFMSPAENNSFPIFECDRIGRYLFTFLLLYVYLMA